MSNVCVHMYCTASLLSVSDCHKGIWMLRCTHGLHALQALHGCLSPAFLGVSLAGHLPLCSLRSLPHQSSLYLKADSTSASGIFMLAAALSILHLLQNCIAKQRRHVKPEQGSLTYNARRTSLAQPPTYRPGSGSWPFACSTRPSLHFTHRSLPCSEGARNRCQASQTGTFICCKYMHLLQKQS